MSKALKDSNTGIIAEFKRRSPSKGWIKEEGRAEEIPLSYQENGATALSILTDEKYFGGKDEFIRIARHAGVQIPILYKNFIIDEYQLFQARLCGASAVLLIAADLTKKECKAYLHTAHELGLEVLLEMHGEEELEYAELEPDMCGINNRHLGSFITDVQNSFRLASLLPVDSVKVSESGISNPQVIKDLRLAGFHGFLIGETFMKTEDPGKTLKDFISKL
jgi:indole-3-glycerol phosphate synthase